MPEPVSRTAVLRPFYESSRVTLYCADCEDVLPTLDRAHLLVTDPPYGVDYQSNRRAMKLDKIAGDDGTLDVGRLIDMAARKIARGRHAYVFGPDVLLPDGVLTASVELVWDKTVVGTGDLSAAWSPSHETITFAVQEISAANRAKGYGRLSARVRKGSVLRHLRAQGGATGRHPNEKPVPLLRELIESSSSIGETVLDPFAGCGSTLVAAVLEGRNAIGIEVSEAYCAIAADRLRTVEAALDGLGRAA